MNYSELHCISNFSFLTGASHPEELLQQAAQLGYKGIAITDECSLAGVVRAHVVAKQCNIQLIIGSTFKTEDSNIHFAALAPNRQAYGQLSKLVTLCRRREKKGQYRFKLNDLRQQIRDCLLIWFPNADYLSQRHSLPFLNDLDQFVKTTQNRLWIGVEYFYSDKDTQLTQTVNDLQQRYQLPLIACGNVHMHIAERKPLQDIITAIRLGLTVQSAGVALHANRERYLRPIHEIIALYPPALIEATQQLCQQCHFSLDELRYEYPEELVPPHITATEYLKQLVEQGIQTRWPLGPKKETRQQIQKELGLIQKLSYEYYFLTVHDIVQFARNQNILCQGRGSAANSVVCFCLGITEVDPEKIHLLFERFISEERNEPPDIDVDFEHSRREEVIQYIYKQYGRERAAIAATVITYRPRSAIRDVGKAMGFDPSLIDHLAKSLAWWDKREELKARLQEASIDIDNPMIQIFRHLMEEILGFPRHLSQHVGGFIISRGPLDQLVPIENASMPDRTIIQWDKNDIEALGLLKIDVLALGMLSAIHKSFDLIKAYRGEQLSMAGITNEDPKVYDMLQQGDSIGVFQVESRAQMAMLPRLRPACFYDLVIEVAIVRPGPIQGNMVHPFLKRRAYIKQYGTEKVRYPSPEIQKVLERTLGIPIFQEQVIELATVAAGFTPGEADQLRRSMASWRKKGELQQHQNKLSAGLLERGYSLEFAQRIIEQINGFGEYGFPESHAASFALLVYVSAWLKHYEPAVFLCSLLNSYPMGFYSPSQLVQDAKRHGVKVHPIDILTSQWDHSLEILTGETASEEMTFHKTQPNEKRSKTTQPAVRLGLRLIKGLKQQTAERIINARTKNGIISLDQLTQQAKLNRQDLDCLAHANALVSLCGHRFQARWQVQRIEEHRPLFGNNIIQEENIILASPKTGEAVLEDYASTGLTLGQHPMLLLRNHPAFKGCTRQSDLPHLRHKQFVRVAGIVTGRQRPGSASGVLFLTLEDETGNINIIVWKDLMKRQRKEILKAQLLHVKGVIEREKKVIHVIAGQLKDCSDLLGDLSISSRDFH